MKHILILLALIFSMASVNAQSTSVTTQPNSSEQNLQAEQENFSEKDYAQVFDKVLALAVQGDAYAQLRLAEMYELGQGVDQDYTQAFDWFEKAALQGHADAQWKLGDMYQHGRPAWHTALVDIEQKHIDAQMWYILSSWEGSIHGQNLRDELARYLSPHHILSANKKAVICHDSNYQDCNVNGWINLHIKYTIKGFFK